MSTTERDEVRETGQDEVRQIYDPVADTPARYRRDPAEAHPPLDYPPYKSTQLRHPKQPLIVSAAHGHRDHRSAARSHAAAEAVGQ